MKDCSVEYCELYILSDSDEKSEKIIDAFENTDFSEYFDLYQEEANHISVAWEYDTDSDTDAVLEDFNKWLGKEYNCTLCGHIIVEADGIQYRGEMVDGRMEYESSDWLLRLPLNEIHRLYNLRRESPWEYVELHCEHCGHQQPVIAEAEYMHHASTAVVYYQVGPWRKDVGLDWSDMDAGMDFEYRCAECGETLAYDLEEVLKKYEKERKGE